MRRLFCGVGILLCFGFTACQEKPTIWIYTSIYKETILELDKALQDDLPHIRVRFYQSGSENISAKVNAELTAGKPRADLVLTSDPFWYEEMTRAGELLSYKSDAAKDLPAEFVSPMFSVVRLPVTVIVYDKMKVGSLTIPQSFADLQNPEYQGKLTMPSPLESGSALSAVALLSRKYGWAYFENLRKNSILSAGGNSSVIQRIESGESKIGLVLLENILKSQKKNPNLSVVYPTDGALPIASPIAILKDSSEANEARAVYDWFYSPKAQTILTQSGMYSLLRNGPHHPNARALNQIQLSEWNNEILSDLFDDRQNIKETFVKIVLGKNQSSGSIENPIVNALLRTIAFGLTVAFFSGLIGFGLAFVLTRVDLPMRNLLSSLASVPYALPAYLIGMSWIPIANPSNGVLASIFPGQTGIYGFWGMCFVETCVAFVFPFLEMKAAYERLDPSLEEAARISGASTGRILFYIHVPLLWPSLLNGILFSFLYTISAFAVPALLGLPAKEFVLTTWIYSQFKLGGIEGMKEGMMLSLLLLGLAVIVMLIHRFFIRVQSRKGITIQGGKASRPSSLDIGMYRIPITIVVTSFLALVLVFPLISLLFASLAPHVGELSPSAWTLANFSALFALKEFKEGLSNSIFLSLSAAFLCTLIGFLFAFAKERKSSRFASAFSHISTLVFSTPGTVIALVLVFGSIWFTSITQLDVDSWPWMLFSYTLKYVALPLGILQIAFRQTSPVLEEAARLAGASGVRLLGQIWLPILKGSVIASLVLVFLPVVSEMTMSVLLTGPGSATLGTVLFQLQEYADQTGASALAFLILLVALILSITLNLRRKI